MKGWLIPVLVPIMTSAPVSSPRPAPLGSRTAAAIQQKPAPGAEDLASVPNLPAIGKWMLNRLDQPAEWLGRLFEGKALREPINVILIDGISATPAESVDRLVQACEAAGYPPRVGHSSGYRGLIGGQLFPQIPSARGHAFANEPFEFHNNHGRLFGPLRRDGEWLYIGAFSREKFDPLTKVEHLFVSFIQAREDFARRLDSRSDFRLDSLVDLGNALTGHPSLSTGDHDGRAVVLRIRRPPVAGVP